MEIEEAKLSDFLKHLTETAKISLVDDDEEDIDELEEAMKSFDLQYPSKDFAPFKGLFAYTDSVNKNGCIFDDVDVTEETLKTLRGKPVNFDHQSKQIAGFWLGAKKIGKDIHATGVFFKNALQEEYEELKAMIEDNNLKISMEAWGEKEMRPDNTYYLRNINFAGGALLRKTKPAFPRAHVSEMASVLEIASVDEFNSYIVNKEDSHDVKVVAKAINVFKEVFQMDELIATLKEGASEATVTVLDQISLVLAKSETDLAATKAELASKSEEISGLYAKLGELEAARIDFEAKLNSAYNDINDKIWKAKSDAYQVAAVKTELGEFAKEMTDDDCLDPTKVEIARLKMLLAKKDKEIASVKEMASAKAPELVVASAGAKPAVKTEQEKHAEFCKRRDKIAFGE